MMRVIAVLLVGLALIATCGAGALLGSTLGWAGVVIAFFIGWGVGALISPALIHLWEWEPDDRPLRD